MARRFHLRIWQGAQSYLDLAELGSIDIIHDSKVRENAC